jgi:hypothetical protein
MTTARSRSELEGPGGRSASSSPRSLRSPPYFSIEAHPLGGVLLIALDVLAICGLTVHADAFVPGGIEDGPMAPPPEPLGRPFA